MKWNAGTEKIAATVLAVGIIALAQWPPMAGARDMLMILAGGLPGATLFKGSDERHAAREAKRASMAPPAP